MWKMENNTSSLVKDKKGQIGKKINSIIGIIITVIVLFLVFANIAPEAQTGGDRFISDACSDAGCAFDTTTRVCDINSSSEGEGIACDNPVDSPPLASIFSGSGIVIILLMIFLFIMIIRMVIPSRKK